MRTIYKVGIVIVVVFLALIVAGALFGPQQETPTTSTSAQFTKAQSYSSANTVSSSTSTSSSKTVASSESCCSLRVLKTTEDDVLDSGSSYFYLLVNITYLGGGSWRVSPYNFQVRTDSGAVYSLTYSPNEENELQAVTLNAGQYALGEVAFKLPSGQKPSVLSYNSAGFSIETQVPDASSWVSEVKWIDTSENFTYFVTAYAFIKNNTIFFRTGERLSVELTISYYAVGTPSQIKLTSVTLSENGFSISQINPQPPVIIKGDGNDVYVMLTILDVSSSSYLGDLHLSLTFSI